MRARRTGAVLVLLMGLLGWQGPAGARELERPGTGVLEAIGPEGEPLGACPLRHTAVEAEVAGFVARFRVTQTFENPFHAPIEAVYAFPLGERAAVDAMWIRTDGREIRGEIRRREEARRIYERARARGQLAALLDQERPNIFTQRVANLMPGAPVEIVIEYVEPLAFEAGEFELVFPTVVGPRFIPGRPGGRGRPSGRSGPGWSPDTSRVPDASRITPPVTPQGTRAGHDIEIEVTLEAGVTLGRIEAPLHAIHVERRGETGAHVTLERRSEIPNRDFVLRWVASGSEVRSGYLAHRDDGDGYLTLVLLPPQRVAPAQIAPRELVFVIDRSGSQSGRPLLKAKETLLWILDRLGPRDTFQVVDFSSSANFLFDRPMPVTPDTLHRAREHVSSLRANGGTLMAEAIQRVAAQPADGNRLRIVTFMTDGYVGNDYEVLSMVRDLRGTSRWFPFGTGNSVNRFLLDEMARQGGGEVEYVLLDEPGDAVARRFWERIDAPVLTDVHLEFRGLDVYDVYPDRLADVWAERPLVVHARYRSRGRGQVVLRGYRAGRPWEQTLDVRLPSRQTGQAALASMWARARVDDLMARDLEGLQSGSFPDALREEIILVALRHRLLTRFTSFVAVEDRVVNEGGVLRTVPVPVEMPQGVEYEGVFGADELRAPRAAQSRMQRSAGRADSFFESGKRAPLLDTGLPREEAAPSSRPLPERVRERLAPELRALIEHGSAGPGVQLQDGRVRVKVHLADTGPEALRRLEGAGLEPDVILERVVIGEIAVERLGELAALDGVERISAG